MLRTRRGIEELSGTRPRRHPAEVSQTTTIQGNATAGRAKSGGGGELLIDTRWFTGEKSVLARIILITSGLPLSRTDIFRRMSPTLNWDQYNQLPRRRITVFWAITAGWRIWRVTGGLKNLTKRTTNLYIKTIRVHSSGLPLEKTSFFRSWST